MHQSAKIILIIVVLLVAVAGMIFIIQNRKPIQINNPLPNKEQNTDTNKESEKKPTASMDFTEIVRGNQSKNQVVFTFDGGAGIQSLQPILDTLKKYKIKGTFFITGKWAENNVDLVKQISDAGHEIFNHTYDHPHLPQLTNEQIIEELNKTDEIISKITGKSTKPFFRAPFGERDSRVLEIAKQAGYRSIYWTIDALDWKESEGYTSQQAKQRVLNNLKPGTIYLMHVGDNITGQILDELFVNIENKGYSIVPLTKGII
jgi:peptidoglycan/xylan/chitin deacetylase (PgdA/CDA1 family)